MKITTYITLIVSLLLNIACGDSHVFDQGELPNIDKPNHTLNTVRINLDTSPSAGSMTRSGVVIKEGYFFLVSKDEDGVMKLVETVHFGKKDLQNSDNNNKVWLLELSLNAVPGEYLALTLLNPSESIKRTLENTDEPWLATADFDADKHLLNGGDLIDVLTNIVPKEKEQTLDNLYPKFVLGSDQGVIIPVGRVLSKISWKDRGAVIKGRKWAGITHTWIEASEYFNYQPYHIYRSDFGIVNLPNRFYLWPQFDSNNMPYSYYEGSSDKNTMAWGINKYVIWNGNGNAVWAKSSNDNFSFIFRSIFYIPENIATFHNGRYKAYRGCASAVILRFTATTGYNNNSARMYSFYRGTADKVMYIYPERLKTLDGEKTKDIQYYNNGMFLYFYIEDPNHTVRVGRSDRTYPSVFRNTNYVISYKELRHIGTVIPMENVTRPHNNLNYEIFPGGDSYSLHSYRPKYRRGQQEPISDPIITTE